MIKREDINEKIRNKFSKKEFEKKRIEKSYDLNIGCGSISYTKDELLEKSIVYLMV